MKGLYIHIPFCENKCGYCDFYSVKAEKTTVAEYVECVCEKLTATDEIFDTVYFGGGTPSCIGGENIAKILSCAKYKSGAEVTVECNPCSSPPQFFSAVKRAGVNRVSVGLQSADEKELKFLTRTHSKEDVKNAVNGAKAAGIHNISLDVIIGLPGQTLQSIKQTLDFCADMNCTHISCYILKAERGTPLYSQRQNLPSQEEVAEMYLFTCDYLEKLGFAQYEISNFAKPSYKSRHNLIYWNCEEYLGLGPAAHSYIGGKRYFYNRDLQKFLNGEKMTCDGEGGTLEEYIMLRLRLNEGIKFKEANKRGYKICEKIEKNAKKLKNHGLLVVDKQGIRLTKEGFLIQNKILAKLLEEI